MRHRFTNVISVNIFYYSDFDYKYISKSLVDLHDENENLLIFATRMDEILFPNERHVRLEKRDPRKVKWLYDVSSFSYTSYSFLSLAVMSSKKNVTWTG